MQFKSYNKVTKKVGADMINLKNRRLELGLTMKQVAKHTGVTEATVSRWESGHIQNMKSDKIKSYAEILQLSPVDLIVNDVDEVNTVNVDISSEERDFILWFRSLPSEKKEVIRKFQDIL